jgi:Flp pilus assembly CpaE family ATPase
MAEKEDLTTLLNKVEQLEARLGLPQKLTLSREAATSGEARKKALQLADSGKSQNIAAAISALADQNNVVVEWSAREIQSTALASVRCCCCCCCCIVITSW